MSELHYPDLFIRGFRGLSDLSLSSLGRVNLITGKNNSGKSSILEALRLHAQNGAYSTISSILSFREENVRTPENGEHAYEIEKPFQISALFHGYPQLSGHIEPIVISTSGKSHPSALTMSVDWFIEERDEEGRRRLVDHKSMLFEESEPIPALVTKTEDRETIRSLESITRYAQLRRNPRLRPPDEPRMPCLLVSPYVGLGTYTLGELWDDIHLTDDENDVIEALRIIDPRITAVGMVGGEGPSQRRAIVRASHINRPVPLRSFGDGLNRLFAIILSLVGVRNGILLIDEVETGLHHTVQLDIWRVILRLSIGRDVQVFATTHSKDAVEAFQQATAETPEEGTLVRLAQRGDSIVPTIALEDELGIATRHDIEVR